MDNADLRSLLDPGAYDEDTTSVELLQTHISWLFLTDRHVYKVKKPVNFGFLDFSTPEKRLHFCREEVRLNSRLCPGIYLGVSELRREGERLGFGGRGRVVDHAVKMKRLPRDRMMGRLLEEGLLGEEEVEGVARIVAAFHLSAETNPLIAATGGPSGVAGNWRETVGQLEKFIGDTLERDDFEVLRQWGKDFLREREELFSRRASEGHVRDCNGDLHMDNICLSEEICIFDCIEFNDRFRYIDTASDISFLLMDFDYRGRPDLGRTCLATYLAETGDSEALPLLPFYKTYRAMVRGKVESLKLLDPQVPEEEAAAARAGAEAHLRLARGYVTRERTGPFMILMSGLPATGKSTVAKSLARELGAEVLRSDVVRKELAGVPPARNPVEVDRDLYSLRSTEETYAALLSGATRILGSGGSVVVDATFRTADSRRPFLEAATSRGVRAFIVVAVCSEELAKERLTQRDRDPGEVSDATWETYCAQKAVFEAPRSEEATVITVDTGSSLRHNIRMIRMQSEGVQCTRGLKSDC